MPRLSSARAAFAGLLAIAIALAAPAALKAQAGLLPAQSAPSGPSGATGSTVTPPIEVAPDSPRASLSAYFTAAREARWEDAARYLVLPSHETARGPELARRLKVVLDRHLLVDIAQVSPQSDGRSDDGQAPDVEILGSMQFGEGAPSAVRMERHADSRGAFWAFSQGTVEQVDAWYNTIEARWIIDWLSGHGFNRLLRRGPFELMWWQWIALLLALMVSWIVGRALGGITRRVLKRVTSHTSTTWDDRLVDSVGPPISVAWLLFLFAAIGHSIGLSLPAERVIRQMVVGLAVATIFWALWRSVTVIVDLMMSRTWAVGSASARNLLNIGGNLSKGVIGILGVLALLSALGFPVTTLLAGLGIGGLAFAFGAQKTVENLFGSIAIAADQPFRVGDFVRVGDFTGTVEDIGLRSTRFRTPDRTLITIPNGQLSDQRLESLAERDRIRLSTIIGLEYQTTRAQVVQVLDGFRKVLEAHPRIWRDNIVVHFNQLGANSLDIEVVAWFRTEDAAEFNRFREEVLLEFMRVVEEAGVSFAFPTRTVHLFDHTRAQSAAPAADVQNQR